MCGIVGYIGTKEAIPIILNGLRRLEYRGYDSAGIAYLNGDNTLKVFKKKGKVNELVKHLKNIPTNIHIAIGHTRWATHGAPNDINAHPQLSASGKITVIHNGIIENYSIIKEALIKQGYNFVSETDTEVIANLIEEIQSRDGVILSEAVRLALNEVIGAYAIVVMSSDFPDELIAARKSSPLVIGIGENEFFLASDATPIVEHTKNVVYLNDEEIVSVKNDGTFLIKTIENKIKTPFIEELQMELEMLERGGYDYFMLKEIYEQPTTVKDSMRGRLNLEKGTISLGGIKDYEHKLMNAPRIILLACGTSWHAALIGEYLFEDLARIPVEVDYASEFRYRNPIIKEEDVVIAISQSGETLDTMAAIELAKSKGATVLGICNVVGSTISRITDAGCYTHAGPEIGVASTKAFTAQVTILTLMALLLARKKGTITDTHYHQILIELDKIPAKIEAVLKISKQIEKIAAEFKDARNFLYLGRAYNFPIALEGALKLKEISYIHAEGYPAAEMKHGPIALIDEEMPVVVIATNQSAYEKITNNIMEVKARRGKIIAIVAEGNGKIKELADYAIEIPETEEILSPLLSIIPLQILAYHIALMRGCNVDQPRNLAKSVTVE
ncbi:MAG: glutamine--fructose-6-phosphate transaminase (isomerizing) [Bacteroidetes bacterium]|nr:glutamine--fructose-6-phosphate transaminase (isomerizing) [Bacteroidota bacterium]